MSTATPETGRGGHGMSVNTPEAGPMSVRIHVERLVLHGIRLAPGRQAALGAALTGELARLLGAGGVGPRLAAGGAVPELPAATIAAPRSGDPRRFGRQIARAVHRGLAK